MIVISSNIRFNNPADKSNSWDNRKSFYYSVINQNKPQIIGSQEGREDQLRELEQGLVSKRLVDTNRTWIEQRMYPCLYVDKSIKVLDSGDRWLSDTPEVPGSKIESSAFPRLMTWSLIEQEQNRVFVFNLHLDHTTDEVREAQALIAIEEILKINKNTEPLIVVGDFNSSPDSKVYKYFIEKLSLIDPWRVHGKSEETSYHKFHGKFPDGKRIDWILHSNTLETRAIELLQDHDNGKYPSDHFPVFCDIIIKNI
jgi:endonuclease/exonuclease/phosphatase family metal-dependent hydrolase